MAGQASDPIPFEEEVDEQMKAVHFQPFRAKHGKGIPLNVGGSRIANPHMRAFWWATGAFMVAFMGWFALAPLTPVLRVDLGLCENDAEIKAILEEAPHTKYEDLPKCECGQGTTCKETIHASQVTSMVFDILVRCCLGGFLERFGPIKVQSVTMLVAAAILFGTTAIYNGTGLIAMRFLIGMCGSTFVTNQFWTSIMFSKRCIGTANATSGGWGNLGGGLTQVLIPLIYTAFRNSGASMGLSWRLTLCVPATLFVLVAMGSRRYALAAPTGEYNIRILGKTNASARVSYGQALLDYRVLLMIFQYSASFGTELVMNNFLAYHFNDYFEVPLVAAGALALGFGGMNLFARSLGGILSDWAARKWDMRGRLWVNFLALLGSSVFMFLFGCVTKDMGYPLALLVLIIFSTFINMAEGTGYGIVPFMQPENLGVVSALVGAGGSAGGGLTTAAFYYKDLHALSSLKCHAAYIMVATISCFFMGWQEHGYMFTPPRIRRSPVTRLSAVFPEVVGQESQDGENNP